MRQIKILIDRYLKKAFRQASSPFQDQMLFEMHKNVLDISNLNCLNQGVSKERYADHDIVVSLTTFGKRIHDVYLPIESIMQGSIKPNRIILNLDYSFKDKTLPSTLQRQIKRGLEISFCKDIRSYTKLIPTLHLCPDAAIITIDDDLIYNFDFTERLIIAYQNDPKSIHGGRIHTITTGKQNKLLSYSQWLWGNTVIGEASNRHFFTGVGGVIYPPPPQFSRQCA